MRKTLLLLALIAPAHAVGIRVATFNVGARFTESSGGFYYPEFGIGAAGTPDHESVKAILGRIDADVVALQEIDSADSEGSPNDVQDLATSLGYPHVFIAPSNGSGGLVAPFDSDLRVAVLSRHPFLTATAVRSPAGAKELTRLHAAVKVDVPGTTRDPVILNTHLKPGGTSDERFRRAVEMKRLVGHLAALGLTSDDNYILTGDFNLNPNYASTTFNSLPSGLPDSYGLGDDYPLPISYSIHPLAYFSSPGAARLDPRQLNGSAITYPGGAGYTLDLFLVSPAIAGRAHDTEIYNSTLDTSNTSGLPKAGSPLASGTSAAASDHYAVFADLELDSDGPYVIAAAGAPVTESFSGFGGNHDPGSWTTGGLAWRGTDDGTSAAAGLRSYGTGGDGSLGLLPGGDGTTAAATFTNGTGETLTSLAIAFDVEQWRAALGGAADGLTAGLHVNGGAIPLPGLSHVASQDIPTGAIAGGLTTPKTTTASGLAIPPGANFELRVSFTPGTGEGALPADVFLNEFHYDNDGTDAGEFIEVVAGPGFSGNLSDLGVVLYNGGNPSAAVTYGTPLGLGSFSHGGTFNGYTVLYHDFPQDGLQNGGNDGFAIVNTATSQVLQLVSYEGSFTASNGPAAGMTSVSAGVTQSGATPAGSSLGLAGTGGVPADFQWAATPGTRTKGTPNSGQSLVPPALPPQGLAIDNVRVTAIADGDTDRDGQPDAAEIAFGTDPLNATSIFRPVITRDGGLSLSFPGASGITYTVESSDDLTGWDELSTHAGNGQIIVAPLPAAEPAMFFRVKAGG